MEVIDVYAGLLRWARSVPCADKAAGAPHEPSPEVLASTEGMSWVCLLNETRVRRGRYEILHYLMDGFHDDGPPAIDQIVEACHLIEDAISAGTPLTIFAPEGDMFHGHAAFSALCCAAHRVLIRGEPADSAWEPWRLTGLGFFAHSWASKHKPSPPRTLLLKTCLQALELARDRQWFDVKTFDAKNYVDRWNIYDVSWVIKGEILLAADPMSTVLDPDPSTAKALVSASDEGCFASMFKADGVKLLVRLNLPKEPGLKESYDPKLFLAENIDHLSVAYEDLHGGVPPKRSLQSIVSRCGALEQDQAVAFHCKAGFGRSGACAAVVAVHRHDVPGELVAAWLRMCRPGALTTMQQVKFLSGLRGKEDVEKFLAAAPCCVVA